jgi:hypothetical protein
VIDWRQLVLEAQHSEYLGSEVGSEAEGDIVVDWNMLI